MMEAVRGCRRRLRPGMAAGTVVLEELKAWAGTVRGCKGSLRPTAGKVRGVRGTGRREHTIIQA